MKKSIVIVGAGLVGCVSALYFARRGYEVMVYERRADIRSSKLDHGRSINLALSHRGIRALHDLELTEKVLENAVPVYGRCVHQPKQEPSYQAYSFHPNEFNYAISREDLNKILLKELNCYSHVQIKFEQAVTVDYLKTIKKSTPIIIADGASSHIRRELIKSGDVNFIENVSEHSYKELLLCKAQGSELKKNYLHIWPKHEFMLIALPNLDKSFTCTLFMPTADFSTLNSSESIQAFFYENFLEITQLIPDLIQQFQKNPTSSLKTISGAPWFVDHQLLLIGDAAHAILPFLGQGMNSGFEDCQLLEGLLNQSNDNWQTAFQLFSNTRRLDTDAIAELSFANYLEMRQKVINKDYLQKRETEQQLAQQYPEKYRTIYELISYTSMPYADILKLKLERDE